VPETSERHLAKERVRNASRAAVAKPGIDSQVGTQGAIALALLDVASAIREHSADRNQMRRLLAISDSIVEAVLEDKDPEQIKRLAVSWTIEREGIDIDQGYGLEAPPGI